MLDHLEQLAFLVKTYRETRGLTQEQLGKLASDVGRTAVAHLEQARKVPPPSALKAICDQLAIPEAIWRPFAREESSQRQEFEAILGELVGRTVRMKMMHLESVQAAERSIADLFSGDLTVSQAYDTASSILVYYGVSPMKRVFFDEYFGAASFQSLEGFAVAVRKYQAQVIRVFSTFGEAYRRMNGAEDVGELLAPLAPRSIDEYSNRTVWERVGDARASKIKCIEEDRLPYLGYISVANYRSQKRKRELLARYLRELAESVRKQGADAVDALTEKRRRKLDSLLRELDSRLQHTPISPLFTPNPADLEAEASRILRDEADEQEMARTQSEALTNLSNYISADYTDVYVATSMRTDSDFIAVNRFVSRLFAHERVAPLRLRYFNPTQSWIEDRVAKGLVEALMLRRANYTIYMAQKSDTFGKDSEASVALGQGKPVIVYVPSLVFPETELDSEAIQRLSESRLRQIIKAKSEDGEADEDLDKDGLMAQALTLELGSLSDDQLVALVRSHWADFGLLDESDRIRGKRETARRELYTEWLNAIRWGRDPQRLTPSIREDVLRILVATTVNLEKRARVFRAVHPLALQVILSTGVLNGILVARTVESCAILLRGLVENSLELDLRIDGDNYRLVERSTESTIRVISRNSLLVNAFDHLYERF